MKRKGTNFERELLEELWRNGFAAVRVAGSGSMSYPSPDIVASDGKRVLAFEVKMRRKLPLHVKKGELEELVEFSKIFGAEPYLAVRVAYAGWRFFKAEEVHGKIDEETFARGLELGEVLGKFRQLKVLE
ncbi:MAG: Holliday junction resolvase Hjc [Archaeoglobaceae archaeon]